MFHIIRGSPDPFFVEFLVPGVLRDQRVINTYCSELQPQVIMLPFKMNKRLFVLNLHVHSISIETATIGVDKGSALQLLCNHLDMPVQDTIAFGDGENDQEFLAVAGFGCAMKNARPAAKSAANVVIEVMQCLPLK